MKKFSLLLMVLLALGGFFYLDGGQYLSLEYLSAQQQALEDYHQQSPWLVAALYFVLYVLVTAFSLPGAAIMTLAGGAIFGFGWGLLLTSFASSIGATLAFLIARSLLHDWVQGRFTDSLLAINRGIEKEGAFYLFTLRLVPVFPFFVINLVMALTPMKTWPFYWVSQVGMLAGTAVYVNAGTQLAQLDSLSGILSPALIGSFALLGFFPWLAKGLLAGIRQRKVLKAYAKPDRFDHNLIVIGAGSAGLVSAYIAATVKASVALIEKQKMGGDCLNTGCVPSKALIRSSRIHHYLERAGEFGLADVSGRVDFAAVMQRVRKAIATIEPHDSVERYSELGVDCVQGEAQLLSPWEVKVTSPQGDSHSLSARHIILASGGRPAIPAIPGLDSIDYLTSDTLWQLKTLPQTLLVIGGGPIGCELAQAFSRLGSDVTMLVRSRLLPKEDDDVAEMVAERFAAEGINVLQPCAIKAVATTGQQKCVRFTINGGAEQSVSAEQVLVAVGRQANTESLGLDKVNIDLNPDGTVAVDPYLRTRCPTIFACGDVAGPYQFTHVASHQAWYASVNALFGSFKSFRADYSVIPWVTFCDPEVARVGLNEKEAEASNIAYEVTHYGLDDLDRAIADSEAHGFVKVLTPPGKDKILGVTIVGYHASELIAEFILAMKNNLGLNKIFATIHIYPTYSEANKFVIGNWKRRHQPERLLKWVQAYHRFRRQ